MNKTIWILWFQGWKNAPVVSLKCLETWKENNPGWNIIELDEQNLSQYINLDEFIPDIKKKNISLTALSDIIRIDLLKKYGGVWADSTVFCHKPLDDWLFQQLNEGFFAFNKPGPDRLLSSWFLAAHENNYLISKWHDKVKDYWLSRNSTNEYYWFHYLFGNLAAENKLFKNMWNNVPIISADQPHELLNKMFHQLTHQIKQWIDTKKTPVSKLTYKYTKPILDNSVIDYLLKL